MQVISSLLAMQSGCTSDATTVEKLEQSQNRIQSIALIHEQLFQAKELADIDMRAYLEMLTSHLVRSFAKADRIDVELRVDDVNMNIDESLACGLIVNELVTNALKHAFPGGRRGLIRVSLSEDASGDHVLAVSDDGVGIGESDPAGSQTMGVSLVRNLARQLRGRVEFSGEGGTGVRIAFPRSSAEVRS